jgi:hypothetical protein
MGGPRPYSKRGRMASFLAVAGLAAGAGCAQPRAGLDPTPFLAREPEARVLERAAVACMSDDRCSSRERIAAWRTMAERFPADGLRPSAELGLALAFVEADRLLDADETVAALEARGTLPPLVRDGLVLAKAALDNRRERAKSALDRLAPLEGRFIDEWLSVRFTRERVLAFKRSGRSEEALRAMSSWVASLRDDSPLLAEARRIAEGFDDVAIETYLRVRSGRPRPEPISPVWLTYLVDRTASAVLRERRPRSAQWLLENPSLSSRLRSGTIDALRLLAAELGRRGTDARARAVVVVPLGDEAKLRHALAFADGLSRQTSALASELVVETLFLEPDDTLERRLGRGVGIDVLVGAFTTPEVAALLAFAAPRQIAVVSAAAPPPDTPSGARLFSVGLDPAAAAKALLAAEPGPVALACIGADCTDIEPLFRGREQGMKQATRVFVRGPVDLEAALAPAQHPVLLGLPDDLEGSRARCLDRVTVRPVGSPEIPPSGSWWEDLGSDVGAFLGTAVRMEGAATTAFALRLQSAIIRARTANPGQFDAHGTVQREFVLHREPCPKND